MRSILSTALVGIMTIGAAPIHLIAQESLVGVIAGKADDTAKKPYEDYDVLLRDPATREVVQTTKLTVDGLFSFSNVDLGRRVTVELLNIPINRVVCTEGPYVLSTPNLPSRTDVNIDCGVPPAAWWLLAAGAGAAAAIALQDPTTTNP